MTALNSFGWYSAVLGSNSNMYWRFWSRKIPNINLFPNYRNIMLSFDVKPVTVYLKATRLRIFFRRSLVTLKVMQRWLCYLWRFRNYNEFLLVKSFRGAKYKINATWCLHFRLYNLWILIIVSTDTSRIAISSYVSNAFIIPRLNKFTEFLNHISLNRLWDLCFLIFPGHN